MLPTTHPVPTVSGSWTTSTPAPTWKGWTLAGFAYLAAIAVTFLFPYTSGVIDAIWPASGIALAILLLSPSRAWLRLLLLFSVIHLAGDLAAGRSLAASLGFELADMAETLLGAWVFARWCRGDGVTFTHLREMLVLVAVAAGVNGATAVLGAATATLSSGASMLVFWRTWWIEDALGILLFTPLIVTWARRDWTVRVDWRRLLEALVVTTCALAFAAVYFGTPRENLTIVHHSYMLLVPLVWAALRLGPRGTTAVLAVFAVVEIGLTHAGIGSFPMGGATPAERILAVQLYLSVKGMIALLLTGAFFGARLNEQEVRRANRALRTLSNGNQALVRATDESALLQDLCRVIVNDGGFRCAWVGVAEHDEGKTLRALASAGIDLEYLEQLKLTWDDASPRICPTGTAIGTGRPVVCRDYLVDPSVEVWREVAAQCRFRSSLSLPLKAESALLGSLSIYAESPDAFDEQEIALLAELADDLAYGIRGLRTRASRQHAEQSLEASEALLRQFIRYTPAAVAMFDADMRYLHASERWLADYHLDGQQIIGRSHYDVFPDVPDRWKQVHQRVLAGAVERSEEDPFPRADGRMEWILWEVRPWQKAGGAVGGLIMFTQVITDRKRADQALLESQAKLVLAMDMAKLGQWELDVAAGVFTFSDEFYALHRTTAAREGGPRMPDDEYIRRFVHPDDAPTVLRAGDLALAASDPNFTHRFEHRIIRADGTTAHVMVRSAIEKDAQGRTVRTYGVNQDITDRKEAEEALRLSEERFRSAMLHSPIGMALIGPDGHWLEVNPALCAILGYSRDELLSMTFQSITYADDLGADLDAMRRLLAHDIETYDGEKRYLHKDGRVIWAQLNVSVVLDEGGHVRYFVCQVQDITERKRTASSLLALNERYARHEDALTTLTRSYLGQPGDFVSELQRITEVVARTVDVGRVSVWRFVGGGKSLVCEDAFDRFPARHSAGAVVTAEAYPAFFHALAEGGPLAITDPLTDPRTSEFAATYLRPMGIGSIMNTAVRVQGAIGGFLACAHVGGPRQWTPDEQTFAVAVANLISAHMAQLDRQRLEAQLRQAQKLEAIGQLAGGVAHDFNNLLTVILGNAAQIAEDPRVPDDVRAAAVDISGSGERAASLTRQLLAFSRRQTMQTKVVDVNTIVRNVTSMLRRILGEDVGVQLAFASGPAYVEADAGMLDQILLNLAINARDAMPSGGQLTIETSLVDIDGDAAARDEQARPGSFVCLRVSDTGVGISADDFPHIFEPFFTTKDVGKGTGLGLATTYGIVHQHDGWIEVESAPGRGTTFRTFLPLAAVTAEAGLEPLDSAVPRGHGETILVVEDEDEVRALVVESLAGYGYQVLDAASGPQALEVWAAQGAVVDLLLTDVVMPGGLNGLALARRLRADRHSLRVVYISGYLLNVNDEGVLVEGVNYLAKPFGLPDLARLIHAQLAGA
ncbi:MAG: PAS domain S-box protein [Acidobacteriota bacterium]